MRTLSLSHVVAEACDHDRRDRDRRGRCADRESGQRRRSRRAVPGRRRRRCSACRRGRRPGRDGVREPGAGRPPCRPSRCRQWRRPGGSTATGQPNEGADTVVPSPGGTASSGERRGQPIPTAREPDRAERRRPPRHWKAPVPALEQAIRRSHRIPADGTTPSSGRPRAISPQPSRRRASNPRQAAHSSHSARPREHPGLHSGRKPWGQRGRHAGQRRGHRSRRQLAAPRARRSHRPRDLGSPGESRDIGRDITGSAIDGSSDDRTQDPTCDPDDGCCGVSFACRHVSEARMPESFHRKI